MCELSVSFGEPVRDVALICGVQTLQRPALQTGGERVIVALDPDGYIPLLADADRPSEYQVRLPMAAVRTSLGSTGRFIQARWRDPEGNWALGPAAHLRSVPEHPSELQLSSARHVLAWRVLPTWLWASGLLLSGVLVSVLLRRIAPRFYTLAIWLVVAGAATLSWPAAQVQCTDLHWRPDPLFLDFVARAAQTLETFPIDLGVEVAGPPELRCRASAAIATQRLRHFASAALDRSQIPAEWARLGPSLEVREEEVLLDRFGDWSLVIPRRYRTP